MTDSLTMIEPILRSIAGPDIMNTLTTTFAQMEWAEDEISQAQLRHPDIADVLYHSFSLMTATHERMSTEFIYRTHARELLERIAAGTSTKPGTSVEVVLALMRVSMTTPLNTPAFGLYLRMWRRAGLPELGGPVEDVDEHYEAIAATRIDEFESLVRRKLAVDDRVLSRITCEGLHHGKRVDCRLAAARAA